MKAVIRPLILSAALRRGPVGLTGPAGTTTWSGLTGVPTEFPPAAHTHSYNSLSGIPALFPPAAHSHAFASLSELPTTLSGFGITDAATATALATEVTRATAAEATKAPLANPAFTGAGGSSISALQVVGAIYSGGTATTTYPHLFVQPTGATAVTSWSTSGTVFGVNAPSGFAGNFLDFHINGAASVLRVSSSGDLVWPNNYQIRWSTHGGLHLAGVTRLEQFLLGSNTTDLYLQRDAAGQLAQRNGVNAQTLRIYNTYTSATNYEAFAVDWQTSANVCYVGTIKGASGSARDLIVQAGGTEGFRIAAGTGACTFSGLATFANQPPRSAAALTGNGTELPTVDQVGAIVTDRVGAQDVTFLAMGQSNMSRGTFGAASYDMATNSKVLIWNDLIGTPAWQVFNPAGGQQNSSFVAGSTIPFHFAKRYQEERGGIVRIIGSAVNGVDISYWSTGGTGWNKMVAQVAASGTTKVQGILWHQGENNDDGLYLPLLLDLISRVRALSWCGPVVPWICGKLAPRFSYANADYETLKNQGVYPYVVVADSGRAILGDATHYTNDSIAAMGREDYYRAYAAGSDAAIVALPAKIQPAYYFQARRKTRVAIPSGALASFKGDFSIKYVGMPLIKYPTAYNPAQWYICEIGRTNLFNGLFAMRYTANGVQVWINDLTDGTKILTSPDVVITSVNYNELHEIIVTRTASTGLVCIYHNKVLIASKTLPTGTLADASNGYIGIASDADYMPLTGYIANFSAYARVLSATDIARTDRVPTPFLEYRCEDFDDAAGGIPDSSGNNYHGTAAGSGSWQSGFVQTLNVVLPR